jgi:hypothetical protein
MAKTKPIQNNVSSRELSVGRYRMTVCHGMYLCWLCITPSPNHHPSAGALHIVVLGKKGPKPQHHVMHFHLNKAIGLGPVVEEVAQSHHQ